MITAKCYKDSDSSISCLTHDLTVGKSYPVKGISMGSSYTHVYLDHPSLTGPYNSIFFQFFEDGKEIDIYRDPRFNPYLKHKQ